MRKFSHDATESCRHPLRPPRLPEFFLPTASSAPSVPCIAACLLLLSWTRDRPEIEALLSGAAVHDLGWMRRIAVRGEDRFRWLSGMVTNMVKDLAPNAGAWNLVLNAQGRIQGDLTVWEIAAAIRTR